MTPTTPRNVLLTRGGFVNVQGGRWHANMKRPQIGVASCLAIGLLLVTGCVTRKAGSPDYTSFPQIKFLPPDQARPVAAFPAARTHGKLSEQDWRAIVALLSRLPEDAMRGELKILNVSAESMWQTVCVHIQIGGNHMVVFVKVNKTDWVVAGIHAFEI